jgi:hypothetical protein
MSGKGDAQWEWGRLRGTSPLAGTRRVREVRAAVDGDSIRKTDGGLMLPVQLSSAPGEGLSS